MIDAKSLLDQFLGGKPLAGGQQGQTNFGDLAQGDLIRRGLDSLGGGKGLAVGGLLGLIAGNKSARKMAGNVAMYGGAAALGLLAWRAYRNYQDGHTPATAPAAQPRDMAQVDPRYLPASAPARNGQPFELALIQAMVAAAKADGHLDAQEQQRLFGEIERMGLNAETKAAVFDLLSQSISVDAVAASASSPEQGAELYLASRIAIDPDHPAEKAHLAALVQKLKLPADLVAHLDRQVEATLSQARAA
ncbi:tellurite resistance TerB family protein [Ferrovibrio terrae]|uniref:tellurite resistance TerB family protein n=1 Tax=Ferrovibrio terrae TaxID=2594003 RepID=UPI003137E963